MSDRVNGRVSIEKAILADVCLGVPLGRIVFQVPSHLDLSDTGPAPDTFLFRGEQLALMKALYARGDEKMCEAVAALGGAADEAMATSPFSVTQKPQSRFSENSRDYQSLAKYWWPNPGTESHVPYVKRDGQVNPDCYSKDFDYDRLVGFSETVTLLALASYLTGREEFKNRGAFLLDTWFVDPETRQTPHFSFAQMSPGHGPRWQAAVESRQLARSIRQSHFDGLWARAIGRVYGGSFRDLWNALRVDGKGSRGTCRRGHGPRVVIAPVMAMSMAS